MSTTRHAVPIAVAALAALLLVACGASAPERPVNVVLFLVDTLRADRLGCYGYPRDTSPHLDRLAARGTLYEENRSQSCWTVPSMISLISGRYVIERETRAPADLPLLTERLQDAGFATAAFLGNKTLANDRGFQRGCDHFEVTDGGGTAAEMVGRFERWFAEQRAEAGVSRGFFAWVHSLDPHHPYHPREEKALFVGQPRVAEEELREVWQAAQPVVDELAPPASPPPFELAARKMRAASNHYDSEVRAADAALGRLLAFLEDAGVLDETLIVFASDHGEKLWEHMRYRGELERRRDAHGGLPEGLLDLFGCGHRAWFHEELWSTPLVFAGPGFPAGARPAGLAANLDIYPTILEALDVSPPPGLAGESLFGGRAPRREIVYAYGWDTTASVDREGRKMIEHRAEYFGAPEGAQPVELFDLRADPGERRDLATAEAEAVAARRALHDAWRERYRRAVDTRESSADIEALRDLGYLDE